MSNFSDVGEFHEKFDLDNVVYHEPGPRPDDPNLMDFRIKFMREELKEFEDAYAEEDHAKMFDSLLDLAYVTFGTAHLLGYPWQAGWDEVQAANMKKVRAAADGSDSVRGSKFDVVKPKGWRPPNIELVLRAHGFPVRETQCLKCGEDLGECNIATYRIDGEDELGIEDMAWCATTNGWFSRSFVLQYQQMTSSTASGKSADEPIDPALPDHRTQIVDPARINNGAMIYRDAPPTT
jgi:predicted HAD superfamily Cof-like phosphohydrolase